LAFSTNISLYFEKWHKAWPHAATMEDE